MASLGKQLRNARRARNKSLEDISDYTNVSRQYLEALEENDYDTLPGPVYTRGFISAYAKCVDLDPKALLEQYDKLTTFNKLPNEGGFKHPIHRRGTRRIIRKRLLLLLITLLVIVLCFLGLLWLRGT